jgi:hypothetical protein
MNYRKFGKDKDKVSILGFGCMRLPVVDNKYENINEAEATMMLRYAIDKGVNYIDTAYPYHGGNSETFLGKALKNGYRDKVFIATKSPSWLIEKHEDLDRFLDEQLLKLQTDYIDYYLLHALNKKYWNNYLKLNVFDFVNRALKSGKIRNIGFSFHDEYEVFEEIINYYKWDFCQIQLNYYDEDYQAGLKGLKLAGSKGIDVVIMEPLRGGRLATNVPNEVQEVFDSSKSFHSAAGWALRYLWNYDEVKVILSGMNNYEHIDDNIDEASIAKVNMLGDEEKSIIKKVKDIYKSRIKVDCTNCKYCMPCPHGVNIPGCFELYNNASVFDAFEQYKKWYRLGMKPEEWASCCQECGLCESKCPQNIEIINELKRVAEYFEKEEV